MIDSYDFLNSVQRMIEKGIENKHPQSAKMTKLYNRVLSTLGRLKSDIEIYNIMRNELEKKEQDNG